VPDTGLAHEELRIVSGEHSLAAWLLHGDIRGPLFVLAHGWGASHATVLQLAEPLARAGHEVLLFDMRGHGLNQAAAYVTVRHLRDDVMAVLRYASARAAGRPVVLVGHSFGGAASVLAAAEGAQLAGLVLIATPSDVVRITAEYLSDKGMPGALVTTLMRPFWWWRIGGTFRPHSPVRRIPELDVPILLIQPEHDDRVRRAHAELLSEAAGVPYHLVEGHEHTDVLGAAETARLVQEFAQRLVTASRSPTPGRSESAGSPTL
jgi:pimeloyl-ACP methyl ester carboxylesterase